MNAVNTMTSRQFNQAAPRVLSFRGRNYKTSTGLYSDDENMVQFAFTARKKRGAFLGDKLAVQVTLNEGLDLYELEIIHVDGTTLDSEALCDVAGVTFEAFAQLQGLIK